MKKLLLLTLIFASVTVIGQGDPLVGLYIDFSASDTSLKIDSSQPENQWEVGIPDNEGFDSAYSPPFAICTRLDENYASNSISSFQVTVVSERFGSGVLEFVHKYDIEPDVAGGYIEISYDNGDTWSNIIHEGQGGGTQNFYNSTDIIFNDEPSFTGKLENWEKVKFDFLWYALVKGITDWPDGWGFGMHENPDTLIFKFQFVSNEQSIGKPGWLIDDISIQIFDISGSVSQSSYNGFQITINELNNTISINSLIDQSASYSTHIFDMYGREVYSKYDSPTYIDISNLPSGMYILHLKSNNNLSQSQKFIRND